MRTVQDILYSVTGQVLVCDALEGRPSSVTSVKVFRWDQSDDDGDEFAPTGTVEVAPSTTTDAAAGYSQSDRTNIPLTATTGVEVGRRYLITNAAGLKEWVEVDSITSGASVTAKHPLHNDYASGSSFVSTRITAPIDATWVADETNIDESAGPNPMFRVRWVYVVGGVTHVQDTYCNLVRYAGKHGVTPQDVEAHSAGWMNSLPTDHHRDQGRRLIDEAYRAVKIDLHAINFDDAAIAESEVIDELVRYRTVERTQWAKFMANPRDQAAHLAAKKEYTDRLDSLVRLTVKVPVRNEDGAGRKVEAIGLTVR